MPKIETPASWKLEEYVCDKCGEGKMKHTGVQLLSYPPQYPHACENCGTQQTFNQRYPNLAYVIHSEGNPQ